MLTIPDRAAPGFAETETVTPALPAPLAPEVTAIQAAWLATVQLQPDGAVTATVVEPALAAHDATPGLIVYEQSGCGCGCGCGCWLGWCALRLIERDQLSGHRCRSRSGRPRVRRDGERYAPVARSSRPSLDADPGRIARRGPRTSTRRCDSDRSRATGGGDGLGHRTDRVRTRRHTRRLRDGDRLIGDRESARTRRTGVRLHREGESRAATAGVNRHADPVCRARNGPAAATRRGHGDRLIPAISAEREGGRPNRHAAWSGTLIDFESLIADGDGALPGEAVRIGQHAKIELTGAAPRC